MMKYTKSLEDMTCENIKDYIKQYDLITVAKGGDALLSCEDLYKETEAYHICIKMKSEDWEYVTENKLFLEYDERCRK